MGKAESPAAREISPWDTAVTRRLSMHGSGLGM